MQALFKASAVTPRVQEVKDDEHTRVTEKTDRIDPALTSGWDAFEVWRTRVRAPQEALERTKRRN